LTRSFYGVRQASQIKKKQEETLAHKTHCTKPYQQKKPSKPQEKHMSSPHRRQSTGAKASPLTVAHHSWPSGSGNGDNCRSAHPAVSNIVDPLVSLVLVLVIPPQLVIQSQSRVLSRMKKVFCSYSYVPSLKKKLPHNWCITCHKLQQIPVLASNQQA
jgi:hypothetical protein